MYLEQLFKTQRPECADPTAYNAPPQEFPARQHYDYGVLDVKCTCPICMEWRAAHAVYEEAKKPCINHASTCDCTFCTAMMSARSTYLATLSRRDIYSEISWHASLEPDGDRLMKWLRGVLDTRMEKSDGWWENRAPGFPISFWLVMFRRSLVAASGMVSGAAA